MPRSRKYRLFLVVFLSIFSCSDVGVQAVRASDLENLPSFAVNLNSGWQIQSSCEAKAAGEQVSTPGFVATGWDTTTVPTTVVGTLVDDKTYPDPIYGTNLK